jgi:FlaA1/EpsC-like NDP-sugar epimerase
MTYLKQTDSEILCSSTVSDSPIWIKGMYIGVWLLQSFLWITQSEAKLNLYFFYIISGVFFVLVGLYNTIKKYIIQKNIKKIDNQQIIHEVIVSFSYHATLTEQDKQISKIVINWHHAGMNLNVKSSIIDKNAIDYLDLPPEKDTISKTMQLIYCKSKPYLYYLRF